jgi:hypothetical protein
MKTLALLLLLPAAAAPAQDATKFNLVCQGSYAQGDSATRVLRVDLAAMRFCYGPCRDSLAIGRVTDAEIVFAETNRPDYRFEQRYNRSTGAFEAHTKSGTFASSFRATCTRAPFSGLPG